MDIDKELQQLIDQARKDEAIRYAHWLKMNEKYVQRMNMNRLTEDQLYQLFKKSWLDESTDAVYAIEVAQNKLYQLYTKEQIINAHMAGQRNAGVDPSYSGALAYYEQSKKDLPNPKCEHTYVDVAGWSQCSKCGDVFY